MFTWHESPPPSSKDSFDLLVTLPNFLFFVFNSILTILKTSKMIRSWIRRQQRQVNHRMKQRFIGNEGTERNGSNRQPLETHSFLILFSLPPHNSCFLSKSCVRSGLGSTKWYSGFRQSFDRKTLKSEVRKYNLIVNLRHVELLQPVGEPQRVLHEAVEATESPGSLQTYSVCYYTYACLHIVDVKHTYTSSFSLVKQ